MPLRVLLVDDDPMNLGLISTLLEESRIECVTCESGREALEYLEQDTDFAVILLDQVMQGMSGKQVLQTLGRDPTLCMIPVIVQTGYSVPDILLEGAPSAYYYLQKPFGTEKLYALVLAAAEHGQLRKQIHRELTEIEGLALFLQEGEYHFQTLSQARSLACQLARLSDNPEVVGVALTELFVNGVEHGNLELGRKGKAKFLLEGDWQEEISRRLQQEPYAARRCRLKVQHRADRLHFHLSDEGPGFAWEEYLEIDQSRLAEPNGRGVAIANHYLENLFYHGAGNQVTWEVPCRSREGVPCS